MGATEVSFLVNSIAPATFAFISKSLRSLYCNNKLKDLQGELLFHFSPKQKSISNPYLNSYFDGRVLQVVTLSFLFLHYSKHLFDYTFSIKSLQLAYFGSIYKKKSFYIQS